MWSFIQNVFGGGTVTPTTLGADPHSAIYPLRDNPIPYAMPTFNSGNLGNKGAQLQSWQEHDWLPYDQPNTDPGLWNGLDGAYTKNGALQITPPQVIDPFGSVPPELRAIW